MDLNVLAEQKALGFYVVSLEGSLDTNTHMVLQEKVDNILKESPNTIAFDMEKLEYISSAGVRVVLKTRKALKENNGKLVFLKIQPQVKKVFDIINALPSMQVFTSIKELDDYLYAIQKKVIAEE
jgi:anti-sigma B factor antagonist